MEIKDEYLRDRDRTCCFLKQKETEFSPKFSFRFVWSRRVVLEKFEEKMMIEEWRKRK